MQITALSSIQSRAPGPPITSAVATPTMFPVPTVADREVQRAAKGLTPVPVPFRKSRRIAMPKRRSGSRRSRRVR